MQSETSVRTRRCWQESLALLYTPLVVRKALLAAGLVGSILVLLNQGDVIFSGQITGRVWLKSLLTPVIPFGVTMLGTLLNSSTSAYAEDLRPGWAAIRRSLIIAVIVGSVIIGLNQGDILLSGTVTPLVLAKVAVTPCVPFCVSLYGAYIAYRNAVLKEQT